jgi:hypothetical protein
MFFGTDEFLRWDVFLVFLVLALVLTLSFEGAVYACQMIFVFYAVLRASLGLVEAEL